MCVFVCVQQIQNASANPANLHQRTNKEEKKKILRQQQQTTGTDREREREPPLKN